MRGISRSRREKARVGILTAIISIAVLAEACALEAETSQRCVIQSMKEMPGTMEDRHFRECFKIVANPITGKIPVVRIGSIALAGSTNRLVVGQVQGLDDCGTGGCRTGFVAASPDRWSCSLEVLATTVELAIRDNRCAVVLDKGDRDRERVYYWDGQTMQRQR